MASTEPGGAASVGGRPVVAVVPGAGGAVVRMVVAVVVEVVVGMRASVVAVVGDAAAVARSVGTDDPDAAVSPTARAAASTTNALEPASAMRRRTPIRRSNHPRTNAPVRTGCST